jgi:superfamily II DNA or RNA helicase
MTGCATCLAEIFQRCNKFGNSPRTAPTRAQVPDPETSVHLRFDRGTIVLVGDGAESMVRALPGVLWDPRTLSFRALAHRYQDLRASLTNSAVRLHDSVMNARRPAETQRPELRPYQVASLLAWHAAGRRGVIALPTGAGKTRVALAAMAELETATLCLVPTRALLHQWRDAVAVIHAGPVGILGDGERSFAPVTLATFESALRAMPWLGNRFGLLIVDEAHHFGGGVRDEALQMCAAPARLGLTATPPEGESAALLAALIGPVVQRLAISDLTGTYLAELDACVVRVALDPEERACWEADQRRFRAVFREFSRMCPGADWNAFVAIASRTEQGRDALAAWRRMRRLVAWTRGKARAVEELTARHKDTRILIFTADNETAYAIARRFLIMPITCDIGRNERKRVLEAFGMGRLNALVSARVLNEGIDVPEAEVAIIVGGTQGQREHVQRIGRLLRPGPGKRACVYELVTVGTHEARQSTERRRGLASQDSARI